MSVCVKSNGDVAAPSGYPSPFPVGVLWHCFSQIAHDFMIQVWQRKRGRQVEGDLGFQLTDASCNFEESVLYGIDLCIDPRCALQPDVC